MVIVGALSAITGWEFKPVRGVSGCRLSSQSFAPRQSQTGPGHPAIRKEADLQRPDSLRLLHGRIIDSPEHRPGALAAKGAGGRLK